MFIIAIIRWFVIIPVLILKVKWKNYISQKQRTADKIELCDDVLGVIYSKLPIYSKCSMGHVNTLFHNIFLRNLVSIIKVQKWFRKHRIEWGHWEKEENPDKKKKKLVRLYMALYTNEELNKFPAFLANKLHRNDLKAWLSQNKINTRRDARTFLNLESITELDIFYAGW